MTVQTLGGIRAAAEHERLRRKNPSVERNARHSHSHAEATLAAVRKLPPSDRVTALVEVLAGIVDAGTAAWSAFDGHVELLAVAEENYRKASRARDEAEVAHARGSVDAREAWSLFEAREVAASAFRARDRELTEAQKPARVPPCGLPNEYTVAREATRAIERMVRAGGVDVTLAIHRPRIDAAAEARRQGLTTEPSTAVWWVLHEMEALGALEYASKRGPRDEREDAADDLEGLREVFGLRWEQYERTQAMNELERSRMRAGLR